jgi:hypothetical protein
MIPYSELSILEIEAMGHFLKSYHGDLLFIEMFKEFRNKEISIDEYLVAKPSGFEAYLKEYKVIRNIEYGKTQAILIPNSAPILGCLFQFS